MGRRGYFRGVQQYESQKFRPLMSVHIVQRDIRPRHPIRQRRSFPEVGTANGCSANSIIHGLSRVKIAWAAGQGQMIANLPVCQSTSLPVAPVCQYYCSCTDQGTGTQAHRPTGRQGPYRLGQPFIKFDRPPSSSENLLLKRLRSVSVCLFVLPWFRFTSHESVPPAALPRPWPCTSRSKPNYLF
jgi:hypothetical protein